MNDSSAHSNANPAIAELHLRMNKKIAQLTKVIFHLNVRNEDYQREFGYLKQRHSQELNQITSETSKKVKGMQEEVQTYKSTSIQLERQYQQEKQTMVKDVTNFQEKAHRQQQHIQEEFEKKVSSLEQQVEAQKKSFLDRIEQLTKMTHKQDELASNSKSQAMEALRKAHSEELVKMEAKHAEEMAELVMSSNAKYNEMLMKEKCAQDKLREEIATAKAGFESSLRESERVSMDRLRSQEQASNEKFDAMHHHLVSKAEKLLLDVEELRNQEKKLRNEREELMKSESDLSRTISRLELQLSKAQQDVESVKKDAEFNTKKLQQSMSFDAGKITELSNEIETLKSALLQSDKSLKQAEKIIESLQNELLNGNIALADKKSSLQRQLQDNEIRLAEALSELQTLRQQSEQRQSSLQEKISSLELQLSILQQKIASAQLESSTRDKEVKDLVLTISRTESQRAELQQKLEKAEHDRTDATSNYEKQLLEMKQSHKKELDSLKSTHSADIEAQNLLMSKRISDLEKSSTTSAEETLNQLKKQHKSELNELQQRFEMEQQTAKNAQLELKSSLQQLQTGLAEKEKALVELTALLKKNENLVVKLQGEKDTLVKSSTTSMKEREENFRKLSQDYEKLQKQHAEEKSALVAQHKDAIAKIEERSAARLKTELFDLQTKQEEVSRHEKALIEDLYQRKLQEMEELLSNERNLAEKLRADASEAHRIICETYSLEQERLSRDLEMMQKTSIDNLEGLKSQHQNEINTITTTHQNEMDKYLKQFSVTREEMEKNHQLQIEKLRIQLCDQKLSEIDAVKAQHSLQMSSLEERLGKQQEMMRRDLEMEMKTKLYDLRSRMEHEANTTLEKKQTQYNAEYRVLEHKHEMSEKALEAMTERHNQATLEMKRLEAFICQIKEENQQKVDDMEKDSKEKIEKLKRTAKQDLDRMLEDNMRETMILNQGFEEAKQMMDDKISELKNVADEWEDRYSRRESRLEDVARIAELEHAVSEKEKLVKKTLDEMAYFKRELLNREEMYNKTFARAPNVGVLQVLKPHVQLQQQMNASGFKNKAKPPGNASDGSHELHRRSSERSNSISGSGKSALPPLNSNNNGG